VSADERAELARVYLAEARQRSVEQLPPTLLMRECAELRRLLGQVLAVLAEAVRDRDDLSEQLAGVAEDRTEDAATITALAERVKALEAQTPQARQLQYEADVAVADLAASGYADDPPVGADRHGPGCGCPYCYDPEDER
jgi:hypothetical protein